MMLSIRIDAWKCEISYTPKEVLLKTFFTNQRIVSAVLVLGNILLLFLVYTASQDWRCIFPAVGLILWNIFYSNARLYRKTKDDFVNEAMNIIFISAVLCFNLHIVTFIIAGGFIALNTIGPLILLDGIKWNSQ